VGVKLGVRVRVGVSGVPVKVEVMLGVGVEVGSPGFMMRMIPPTQ